MRAAITVVEALGPVYRSALRRELVNLPDEIQYYDHGDDEAWDAGNIRVRGEMGPTQNRGGEEEHVEAYDSDPDDGIYLDRTSPDEDLFRLDPKSGAGRTHRSGTMEVEVDPDTDDFLANVMERYSHGGRRATYSKTEDDNAYAFSNPYEVGDEDSDDSIAGNGYNRHDKAMLLYYFYERHNPAKLYLIPTILEDYHREEDELFASLVGKYEHEMEYWNEIADEIDSDPKKASVVKKKLKVRRSEGRLERSGSKSNVLHMYITNNLSTHRFAHPRSRRI